MEGVIERRGMMNDRFKFRAWDKTKNMMVSVHRMRPLTIADDEKWNVVDFQDLIWAAACHGDILMQCTGLKDKNGKLIFEGDIIEWEHPDGKERYDVWWDDNGAEFSIRRWEADGWIYYGIAQDAVMDDQAVVGNIYENPDLIPQNPEDNHD